MPSINKVESSELQTILQVYGFKEHFYKIKERV